MKISNESLVISRVLQSSFSHFFEIILLIVFMLFYRVSLVGIIFYPFIFIFIFLFTLGVSFILASIGVYVNDLNNVWNVITRLVWFITPIFYTIEKGSKIYFTNLFNPMFYFISIVRDLVIYNSVPELWIIITIVIFSIFVFVFGLFVFEKFKWRFAEFV
jgi:ABC-type polysaccharide/polyol phosphate export permease